MDLTQQLAGFAGDVEVTSGRLDLTGSTEAASITVAEGGQLYLSADYSGALSISGTAWEGSDIWTGDDMNAALVIGGSSDISVDTITASGNTGILIDTDWAGIELYVNELAGSGTLTVMFCPLNVSESLSFTGDIVLTNYGDLWFGLDEDSDISCRAASITVGSDAILNIAHASADCSGTDITLDGGTLYWYDGDNGTGLRFGTLTVASDSALLNVWNGALIFAELTGEGSLVSDSAGYEDMEVQFEQISNYSGTVDFSGNTSISLVIGGVDQEAGYSGTIAGDASSAAFSKTGEGSFTVSGTLTITGTLVMTYEGELSVGGWSIADGAVLSYTAAEGAGTILLDENSLEGSVTIDVLDIVGAGVTEDTSINLGISSNVAESALSVVAVDGYTLSAADDYWYITLTAGASVSTEWDANWGAAVLAAAPDSLPEAADISADIYMADESAYISGDGSYTAVLAESTADGASGTINTGNASIVGGSLSAASTVDSWIKVTGGTYYALVGGNYANNWNSGSAANFTGDSHILLEDGIVGYIIGGNYKDGYNAAFTGSTYISIAGGTVTGSIVGAGTAAHNQGGVHTGDTNIYIYVPLTEAGDTALNAVTPNAVIGGSLHVTNTMGSNVMTLTGDTHITVDLSDYEGEAVFRKRIVGGHGLFLSNYGSALLTGDTNVTITASEDITFNWVIIGGSYVNSTGGTSTIEGGTHVTINGGVFESYIVGGDYTGSANGAVSTIQSTSVVMNGGTVAGHLIGASRVDSNTSTLTVDSVNVEITGGTVSGYTVGGFFIGGTASAAVYGTLGDVSLTISGGTVADVYGGSYVNRNNASCVITQGNITVNLLGGTVTGSVYAAGAQYRGTGLTAESTAVNISSAAALGAAVYGGYLVGSGYTNTSTVTGDRTLAFTDENTEYGNLADTAFYDFSIVSVAQGSGVTLIGGIADGGSVSGGGSAVTKTGAGTLTLTGAEQESVTVSEGTLALSGENALTAVTIASGAALDIAAGGNAERRIADAGKRGVAGRKRRGHGRLPGQQRQLHTDAGRNIDSNHR